MRRFAEITLSDDNRHLGLADEPGEYSGISANLGGGGFSDFDSWIATAPNTGSALDDAGYAELAKLSQAVPPAAYRSVEPKLFERIVDQTVSGPERPAAAVWCPPAPQAGG
jgi:cytochrome o ubiquinol oxidase subunit 2